MSQALSFLDFLEVPAASHPKLRWYQEEARDQILEELSENDSTLAVLATGMGKTQVFAGVAEAWDGNVLVLAHRDELVQQARDRLEAFTGEMVEVEQRDLRASHRARIVVGSVQSVTRQNRLDRLGKDRFSLVIADECFPAGTLVDGRAIESYRPGDMVWSVDHRDGTIAQRQVLTVFERSADSLVMIRSGATALRCTGNHPVFVRRGESVGYVEAAKVQAGDLLCLRCGIHSSNPFRAATQDNLFAQVQRSALVSHDGSDQPPLRIQADDGAEPNAPRGEPREDESHSAAHRARTQDAWRKWTWTFKSGRRIVFRAADWLETAFRSADPSGELFWLSEPLQAGPGTSGDADGDRGRRLESLRAESEDARPKEGGVLAWARVDSVESLEPSGPGGAAVYNLEVEGAHTYFADGVLVHNCHHYVSPTYKRVLDFFGDAKRLGVTATPDRGDEVALGQIFQTVAYCMDISEGIEAGYLVPIRGHRVELGTIDISGVGVSGGDLIAGQLDEAMLRATEGIVKSVLELEPDRQGIGFFPGIKTADFATQRMNALRPNSCAIVTAGTPFEERRDTMRRFKAGMLRYLFNVGVATEGFDAPGVSLIIMGRPTKSRALYAQMGGRGTRVLPGTIDDLPGREQSAARRAAIKLSEKPDMVIMDFVGNSGRHSLVGPEDLLGGNYTEAEIAEAKKKESPGGDIRAALEKARLELKRIAGEMASKVVSIRTEFDPFKCFGMDHKKITENDQRFGYIPATDKQRKMLMNAGIDAQDLQALSKSGATKLIATMLKRRELGLADYAQIRALRKMGVAPPVVLSKQNAAKAIEYIHSLRGFAPDPGLLDGILHGAREVGED